MAEQARQQKNTKPAHKIGVSAFRLILQWPLVLDSANTNSNDLRTSDDDWINSQLNEATKQFREDQNWQPVTDLLNYPESIEPGEHDGGGYAQFSYFHDFVQKFLFPTAENPAYSLFERTDMKTATITLYKTDNKPKRCFEFKIERLSMHLFGFGTAMMTLELEWDQKGALCLADTQDIIDYMRRTYTPFWKNGAPQRVLKSFEIPRTDYITSTPCEQDEASLQLGKSGKNGQYAIKVFEHWREMIKPLKLLADGGRWRDPSDERMPINSMIVLESDGHDPRAAIQSIKLQDWVRLADAEESGTGYPYNDRFIAPLLESKVYDRFFPGEGNTGNATRHIIDASHYCLVCAGWFAENVLPHHFRRHYALLSLIARFEFTALLAISSRLTNAVIRYESANDEAGFERDIIAIQGQFLHFVHRYRFSGVSSQLQPSEMFAMWRNALELDVLFQDVRDELESAFQRVTALQQKREAEAATELNKLAGVGVVLGLIAGIMGANIFVGNDNISDIKELAIIAAAVMAAFGVGLRFVLSEKTRFGQTWPLGMILGSLAAFLIAAWLP